MWKLPLTLSAVFSSEVFLRLGTRFCQLSYLRRRRRRRRMHHGCRGRCTRPRGQSALLPVSQDPLQLHPETFIDSVDDPQCLSQPVRRRSPQPMVIGGEGLVRVLPLDLLHLDHDFVRLHQEAAVSHDNVFLERVLVQPVVHPAQPRQSSNIIEAPWLANGGHGASLRHTLYSR
eukprot:COSAG01_NODE_1630_length_9676_cov_5.955101_4_plen_174_part_00